MDSVTTNPATISSLPESARIELDGRHHLEIERREAAPSLLRIVSAEGQTALTIELTERGPVLKLSGPSVSVQAEGALALEAQRVAIRGRESVTIESGGAARIAAQGDLFTEGREQHIKAKLGNVNVKANDDVRMRGERIRLNC